MLKLNSPKEVQVKKTSSECMEMFTVGLAKLHTRLRESGLNKYSLWTVPQVSAS